MRPSFRQARIMAARRTWLGVGPKWAVVTAAYFVVALGTHVWAYPRFAIAQVPFAACLTVGALFVLAGAALYATSLRALRRGLRRGELVMRGPYAVMRHPLYASGVLLIVPGVALACCSWLLLPMPAVAYVACRVVLPAEENELLKRHGERFSRYMQSTNALFPTRPQRLHGRAAVTRRKD